VKETQGIRESGRDAILPDLPSVQAGLTRGVVLTRTARQPPRRPLISSVVYLHLLCDQGATDVHAKYHRLRADCQYTLAQIYRATLTTLVEGIIK